MPHKSTSSLYVCINCGHKVGELYRKFSNSVKTVNCNKCSKIADRYVEFEPVIILVDAMLLSQEAYRHLLYNREFKLFWKLSLMLLLLESFTLWRKKSEEYGFDMLHERGFYICCLQNMCDYLLSTGLLLGITLLLRPGLMLQTGLLQYGFILLKAITLASFSKFFLLPIMLWRENTTEFGAQLHHILVMAHYLCSLIYVYVVVGGLDKLQAAVVVLPLFVIKKYLMQHMASYIEVQF